VRQYAWGACEALASAHTDVLALKRLLFERAWEGLKAGSEARYHAFRAGQLRGGAEEAAAEPPPPAAAPAEQLPPPAAALDRRRCAACAHACPVSHRCNSVQLIMRVHGAHEALGADFWLRRVLLCGGPPTAIRRRMAAAAAGAAAAAAGGAGAAGWRRDARCWSL
jgi:hypothetical protein